MLTLIAFINFGYKGFRPWIILISTTIIAMTSNIWIKFPAKPSKNPNSQRITRITTIVQIKPINLTSSFRNMYAGLIIFSLDFSNAHNIKMPDAGFTTLFIFEK